MKHLITNLLLALITGLLAWHAISPSAHAQYRIEGWPMKKSWGAIRGIYPTSKINEVQIVFEDATEALRFATVNLEAKTAVVAFEMRRE